MVWKWEKKMGSRVQPYIYHGQWQGVFATYCQFNWDWKIAHVKHRNGCKDHLILEPCMVMTAVACRLGLCRFLDVTLLGSYVNTKQRKFFHQSRIAFGQHVNSLLENSCIYIPNHCMIHNIIVSVSPSTENSFPSCQTMELVSHNVYLQHLHIPELKCELLNWHQPWWICHLLS